MSRVWISVPVGRTGIRIGQAWGGYGHEDRGDGTTRLMTAFIVVVGLIFAIYWLVVAFTLFLALRGVWNLLHGRVVVGLVNFLVAFCLWQAEIIVYNAWEASFGESEKHLTAAERAQRAEQAELDAESEKERAAYWANRALEKQREAATILPQE